MIDYFSKSLYSYSIYDTSVMNVKKIFSHHHECDHSMFVAMYWNVDSTFIFFEMKNMFRTLNIIVIQIFNQSHKFVDMIERANKTLRISMKKMIKSKNTQKTILKKNIYAINDRHIEHFDYSLNEIVYDIEFRNINVVNFVKTLKYSKKIVLSFEKKMMFLIWNHIIKKKFNKKLLIESLKSNNEWKKNMIEMFNSKFSSLINTFFFETTIWYSTKTFFVEMSFSSLTNQMKNKTLIINWKI